MKTVSELICAAARDDFEEKAEELRARVKALTGRFPLYEG